MMGDTCASYYHDVNLYYYNFITKYYERKLKEIFLDWNNMQLYGVPHRMNVA